MRTLIADSGTTKTDWVLLENNTRVSTLHTQGTNPYFTDTGSITSMLQAELLPGLKGAGIDRIYFYGAGCSTPGRSKIVEDALRNLFSGSDISVSHDMLAAARALCGREKGIAAIIGTGSNSCLFDGKDIVQSVISLGFLLADEGSGNHIGRLFITDYLYNDLPATLEEEFSRFISLGREEIINKLYKEEYPSRFLASFIPFIHDHKTDPYIRNILSVAFNSFIDKQISRLGGHKDLPIHFCGSVGYFFSSEVKETFSSRGLHPGKFLKAPMEGLIHYHT